MAALVIAAFWGDFIVLPALLAGPLGRILATSTNNQRPDEVEDLPAVSGSDPVPQQVRYKGPHYVDPIYTSQSTSRYIESE